MTERVRELVDELVWSPDDTKDIVTEANKILNEHVLYMLRMSPTLNSLTEWTMKQIETQNKKITKLDLVIAHMTRDSVDCTGVTSLRKHHSRISWRYKTVQNIVCVWQSTYR